jgi:hypothetical protein
MRNYYLGEIEIFLDSVEATVATSKYSNWNQVEERFHNLQRSVISTGDTLPGSTITYLNNLEMRFAKIKKLDSIRFDSIATAKEDKTIEIIDRLKEFAEMNAASFQSIEDSYSDDMMWIDKNAGFISLDKQKDIDSLNQQIENINRSK